MSKELRCGDLMPGCQVVIQGKDEAEVLTKAAEHAKNDHQMSLSPDIVTKVKQAIHDR